jgi:hypothetical protein
MPESVATLGMIDSHHEGHEDYLVVGPNNAQKGAVIQARVNRPETRLAKQLISLLRLTPASYEPGGREFDDSAAQRRWRSPGGRPRRGEREARIISPGAP